ncbi:MAG: hypothetical protein QOF36_1609 [Microbacteriaceae bacterium]|jgi:hypothetical protein|nr:hypothetical protein [Microbacteriaceae bacterium]
MLYPDELASVSLQLHNSTACDSDLSSSELRMGMIGFDIACAIMRSGSRMQGYLVNDLCKQ